MANFSVKAILNHYSYSSSKLGRASISRHMKYHRNIYEPPPAAYKNNRFHFGRVGDQYKEILENEREMCRFFATNSSVYFDQSAINKIVQIKGLQCNHFWMLAKGLCRSWRLPAF